MTSSAISQGPSPSTGATHTNQQGAEEHADKLKTPQKLELPKLPTPQCKEVHLPAAIQGLKDGNQRYLSGENTIVASAANRLKLATEGQAPEVVVLSCADSRVPPELIFDCDAGVIFVVRVAGNVVTPEVFASIEYAIRHLKSKHVVVMGHTKCGAVNAACSGAALDGHLPILMTHMRQCRNAADPIKANVENQLSNLKDLLPGMQDVDVRGAMFDIETGVVDFL